MEPSPSDLARAIERLERRVSALERAIAPAAASLPAAISIPHPGAVAPAVIAAVRPTAGQAELPPLIRPEWMVVPGLLGRTCLALAGAYLLRALTDSGALPPAVGVAAGLAYAVVWFVCADRAPAGARASASFHGLVGSLVAFPIVWEAATRFQLLTPLQTMLTLAAISAGGLGVASHRRLHAVAWIVGLLGAAAALALVPATDRIVPFAVFLIALAVATLWLGYVRDWLVLRWPIAVLADFAVVGLTLRVATGHGVESAATALAIQSLLIAAFLVSIIVRTLVRGRDVIPFEIVQGILALAVGLGGAVAVARAATAGTIAVGVTTLLLGTACYTLAFVFVVSRQGMRANFYFYTTLGLMLVLASVDLLLPDPALTLVLSVLTFAFGAVAARPAARFLVTHAAVYGIAAALASGLLAASIFRLAGSQAAAWPPFAWPMLLAALAPAACEAIPNHDPWFRPPRLVLLLLAMWGGAGWIIELSIRMTAGSIDPGALATVRTGVMAVAALALARAGRADGFREARWMVYPLLLAGGVKLLMEDLPRSRPATLFVAFAAYGVALIAAPRLLRHGRDGVTVDARDNLP